MPQMAPLPWISILMLTILCLYMINTSIFFSTQKKSDFLNKKESYIYNMKW